MTEPDNLVLVLLREMREDMKEMREIMATKDDIADVRSEMKSGFADVASDMILLEKRLSDQIVGLRRAVMEYHSSTIGHGVLMTEMDDRLRRVEQHLNLPDIGAH